MILIWYTSPHINQLLTQTYWQNVGCEDLVLFIGKNKKFKTVIMTSFTLLLWSSKHVWTKWRMCSSFNVVFWLIWRRHVVQPKINVETTLSISTLEFSASNNVKSTLRNSTLMWATEDNVKTTLSFSTSSFTTLVNVETTLWKWTFQKEQNKKSFQVEWTEFKAFSAIS